MGVTLKLYSLDEAALPADHQGCCTLDDVEDARSVCRRLGIPHYVLNMEREFHDRVMDYFVDEYRRGRTPHPCIACNDKIKFSQLDVSRRRPGSGVRRHRPLRPHHPNAGRRDAPQGR